MHGPATDGRVITVRLNEDVRAKNFDETREDTRFLAGERHRAAVGKSEFGIRWLLITVGGKRYGWPELAVNRLIELDRIRVYSPDGEEIESLKDL